MMKSPREQKRELRKANILSSFDENETQYTNQIAKRINVVWPVADRLLQELVDERQLVGDKLAGYKLYHKSKKENIFEKIKRLLPF